MVLNEALVPDGLIKRQTHDRFPCLTRGPVGPCPDTGQPAGHALTHFSMG